MIQRYKKGVSIKKRRLEKEGFLRINKNIKKKQEKKEVKGLTVAETDLPDLWVIDDDFCDHNIHKTDLNMIIFFFKTIHIFSLLW